MYTNQGAKYKLYTDPLVINSVSTSPVLNSMFYGLGATYTLNPNFDLTCSGSWVHYLPESADVTLATGVVEKVHYEKEIINLAVGVSFKM